MRSIIGIDIGGSKIAVVEGTPDGVILNRRSFPNGPSIDFESTLPVLVACMDEVRKEAGTAGRSIGALSISVGGPLGVASGTLFDPPHLPGWHGVNLKRRLEEIFPDLPLRAEHDGNAGALAEYRFGIGRELEPPGDLIFLTFGTGLGAGIIAGGRILYGASGCAGEVGRMLVAGESENGTPCVEQWEHVASASGLVRLAGKMFPGRWGGGTEASEIAEAALVEDAEANIVVVELGRWLGRGLATLIDTLNPQAIVLGTLAVVLGERVLSPARETLQRLALPSALAACRIAPTTFGKQIGDVASLMAVCGDRELRLTLID